MCTKLIEGLCDLVLNLLIGYTWESINNHGTKYELHIPCTNVFRILTHLRRHHVIHTISTCLFMLHYFPNRNVDVEKVLKASIKMVFIK